MARDPADPDRAESGHRRAPATRDPGDAARARTTRHRGPRTGPDRGRRRLRPDRERRRARSPRRSRTRWATEVVSADAMQVYRGLPILTNQSEHPARLVAIRALDEEMSVGAFAALAHAEIDELVRHARQRGRRGRHGPLPPRGARRPRRPAAAPARRCGSGSARRSPATPPPRTRVSPSSTPTRPAPCTRTTTSGSCARSSSPRRDTRSPAGDRLWSAATRRPTLIVGLDVPAGGARATHPRADGRRCSPAASSRRCASRSPAPVSRTAEKALGLREIAIAAERRRPRADRRPDAAVRGVPAQVDAADPGHRRARRHASAARPRRQRCSCACDGNVRSDAVREVACARERLPPRRAARRGRDHAQPARGSICDVRTGIGSDGVLEIVARDDGASCGDPDLEPGRLERPRCPATAPASRLPGCSGRRARQTSRSSRPGASSAPPPRRDGLVRQRLDEIVVAADEVLDIAGERLTVVPVAVGNPHAVVLRETRCRATICSASAPRSRRIRGSATGRTSSSRAPSRVTSSPSSSGSAERARRRPRALRRSPSRPPPSRGAGRDSPVRIAMPGGEARGHDQGDGDATLRRAGGRAGLRRPRRRSDRLDGQLVLAQHVVQAEPQVVRLLSPADDQRAGDLVRRPRGTPSARVPGTTTARGGHLAPVLDRLRLR